MYRRTAVSFLLALALVTVWAALAVAAPRDNAANKKVDEAINQYYLATEFDKAEAILRGTIEACEDRCSPEVKARAWMYVGIVRGSGKQDVQAAQEAFQQALALDPNVKLDVALATPAVTQAFQAAAAALGQAAPAPGAQKTAPLAADDDDEEVVGEMECTPEVREVESRRPVPIACTTDEPASKVTLRYRAFGSDQWGSLEMKKKGEYWQGEIPCSDTGITGKLRFFVRARDRAGDVVDSFGSKKKPVEINIVHSTDEDPPAYPGQPAPQRCMEAGACPEDMIGTPACPGTSTGRQRGNKGWGSPCSDSWECDAGLLCMQTDTGQTCETAPSCEATADCPAGAVCMDGTCDLAAESGGTGGPSKKNWFGLHFAADIAFLSGTGVCSVESQRAGEFACFFGPDPNTGEIFQFVDRGAEFHRAHPNAAGNITGGAALGTMRVLASYERALFGNFGAELRAGFAFNGGPQPAGGGAFLPVHAEVRGKYWFGQNAYGRKGIRPYVHLGGGLAQVDAKLTVSVYDCESTTCPTNPGADLTRLDAYKKMGQSFVTLGGGGMYAFAINHGVLLNLNLMYMLGSPGFVIEPSLGYTFGL